MKRDGGVGTSVADIVGEVAGEALELAVDGVLFLGGLVVSGAINALGALVSAL